MPWSYCHALKCTSRTAGCRSTIIELKTAFARSQLAAKIGFSVTRTMGLGPPLSSTRSSRVPKRTPLNRCTTCGSCFAATGSSVLRQCLGRNFCRTRSFALTPNRSAFHGASSSSSFSIFLWVRGALTHLVPQDGKRPHFRISSGPR